MLTLMAYVRYARITGSGIGNNLSFLRLPAYWGTLLLVALGLMCKPMLVTLPFILLLLDWWPLGRWQRATGRGLRIEWSVLRRLIVEKIPLLLLSAASGAITIWAQKDIVRSLEVISFPLRVGNALVSYAAYVGKMIYPVGLAVLYPYPERYLSPWRIGLSILFLLLISAGVAAGSRKHPFLLLGWLWYLGMLVPVIGLMQVGNQAMADRYTYLPQVGLYIIVAWGVVDLCGSWRHSRAVFGASAAAILAALIVLAYLQTTYWKNDVSLMTHAISCTSDNYLAEHNLAVALAKQGNLPQAIEHYERAIHLRPNYFEAHNNLAAALASEGNMDEAVEHFERALQLKPSFAEAHNNLANVLVSQGKMDGAIEHYERAIQLEPDSVDAQYNLGNALANQGKMDEAVEHFERAIQLKPVFAEAQNSLANALANQGKMDEAIEYYERAIQLKPDYIEAEYNLGNTLAARGNVPQAVQHFQKALDLATAKQDSVLEKLIRTRLESYQ
jgi:tetratricopeptide (TPR) repeat protein